MLSRHKAPFDLHEKNTNTGADPGACAGTEKDAVPCTGAADSWFRLVTSGTLKIALRYELCLKCNARF